MDSPFKTPAFAGIVRPALEATRNHGGLWVQRFARLRRMNALPEGVLVPVDRPPVADARRSKAVGELTGELRELGIEVVPQHDANAIVKFARRFAGEVA